jgi:hypothetical protein
VFRTAKLVTLVCALLCCATKLSAQIAGDFGRPEDSPFVDEFLPWLKDGFNSFTGQHNPASPYTDDERTLRNLAYAILQPPEAIEASRFTIGGADFFDLWNHWIVGPQPFDVRSYANFLIERPYRSSAARYAQLIDDIRADALRVAPFFSMANRVLEADAVRQKSFQFVSRLPGEKFDLARARVAENHQLIDRVYDRFRQRIDSYHYALETLLLQLPSPNAVEAERALFVLEDRLRQMTSPVPAVSVPVVVNGGPSGLITK